MLAVFFLSLLVASWLQWGVLAGAGFVIGSVAAAWYTKPRDLLTAVVSPPLLFFGALICVKALTAKGSMIVSTVEETALTLANVAPWLFVGVAAYLIVAWIRRLPQSVPACGGICGLISPSHGWEARGLRPAGKPTCPTHDATADRGHPGLTSAGWVRRNSGGGANTSRSSTASTSSTAPKPRPARYSSTPLTRASGTEAPLVTPTVSTSSSQAGSIAEASSTR